MKEIRWHGRGGQGAVMGARVLAAAFLQEGKSAIALPKFGAERRGAPVVTFNKVDDSPIREKTQAYHPDCLIVLDPRLMRVVNIFEGLVESGILVMDAPKPYTERLHPSLHIISTVDATNIALEEMQRPITNTCMLGAFARATGWIKLDSILSCLEEYITGSALQKNRICVQRGYEETDVSEF